MFSYAFTRGNDEPSVGAISLTRLALRICSPRDQQAGRSQGKWVLASPLRGLANTHFPCERGEAPQALQEKQVNEIALAFGKHSC